MVESFGIQSCPEGLLETEKSPNLNELEPAFNTKTLTLPDFDLVLLMHRTVVLKTMFLMRAPFLIIFSLIRILICFDAYDHAIY